jgi:hypothetical protein
VTNEEVGTLVSYSLGRLIHGGATVESSVRAALRIAMHRQHVWWQCWCYLQLLDASLDKDGIDHTDTVHRDRMHELLHDAFPEDPNQQEAVFQSVLDDTIATKSFAEDSMFTVDVATLERTLLDPNIVHEPIHRILNRITNRVQSYLMAVERGIPPPTFGE